VLLAVALAVPAVAAPPEQRFVDEVSARLDEVAQTAKSYEQVAGPSGGALTDSEATQRFQDAVYLFLLGEQEAAAEAFFVLLASRSLDDVGLRFDAEWYLAESLLATDNDDIAIARYQGIMREPGHPFREDAVRRLLEIYADDPDSSRFEELYQLEIVGKGVKPSDLIVYTIARSYWRRGETGRAKDFLNRLESTSPWYTRSQYLLGAMLVQAGDASGLDRAVEVFSALAAISPATAEDRAVRDLAQLALARIYLERGRLDEALAAYGLVSDESDFLPEKLHELTWVYIGRRDFVLARETADRFLAKFPDHAYTSELNLVRGHLLFEVGAYDEALVAYDKVVAAYSPVRDRFLGLSKTSQKAEAYVHQVMELERGGGVGEGEEALPGYAVALMLSDGNLSRAVGLFRELERQDTAISAAEVLGRQVGGALGSSADSTGSVQGLRFSASEARLKALRVAIEVLATDQQWLESQPKAESAALQPLRSRAAGISRKIDEVGTAIDGLRYSLGSARAELRASARERDEATVRVAAAEGAMRALAGSADPVAIASAKAELDAARASMASLGANDASARDRLDSAAAQLALLTDPIERDLRVLVADMTAARTSVGADIQMDPMIARLDRMYATLWQALQSLQRVDLALASGDGGQLLRIRDVWKRETEALAAERVELKARYDEADQVAGGLVRANFVRLAEQFGRSVLGADMGAVNVYWASLLVLGDQIDAVASERNRKLRELEREYGYLEQKVAP
jgi:tetratricopeptide (TPR) repeat protein